MTINKLFASRNGSLPKQEIRVLPSVAGQKQAFIAIAWDLDDTALGNEKGDLTSNFLREALDLDPVEFFERNKNLKNCNPAFLYMHNMIQESQAREKAGKKPITRQMMEDYGHRAPLLPGVIDLLPRLSEYVNEISKGLVKVEHYAISSGIHSLIKNIPIIEHFKQFWSSHFMFDQEGRIEYPQLPLSYPDKVPCLFMIEKGFVSDEHKDNMPNYVNQKVHQKRIPFSDMVVIGDGYTDIPMFCTVESYGGTAIGVYSPHKPEGEKRAVERFLSTGRVSHVLKADYRLGGATYETLTGEILSPLAKKIMLREGLTLQGLKSAPVSAEQLSLSFG